MKLSNKNKDKLADLRIKKINKYYNSYVVGDIVYNQKGEKYILVSKRILNHEHYFVVQNEWGEMFIQKLVYIAYNGTVTSVDISKKGVQYSQNKEIFDSWLIEDEAQLNKWCRRYYNRTRIGKCINESYRLVLKREFNNKYYFVLRYTFGKGHYYIAKIVWLQDAQVFFIGKREFEAHKNQFDLWIKEAQK